MLFFSVGDFWCVFMCLFVNMLFSIFFLFSVFHLCFPRGSVTNQAYFLKFIARQCFMLFFMQDVWLGVFFCSCHHRHFCFFLSIILLYYCRCYAGVFFCYSSCDFICLCDVSDWCVHFLLWRCGCCSCCFTWLVLFSLSLIDFSQLSRRSCADLHQPVH